MNLQKFLTAKSIFLQFLIILAFTGSAISQARPAVYPPDVTGLENLKIDVEPLIKMTVAELIRHVPSESGIYFVGCPNCNGGMQARHIRE